MRGHSSLPNTSQGRWAISSARPRRSRREGGQVEEARDSSPELQNCKLEFQVHQFQATLMPTP